MNKKIVLKNIIVSILLQLTTIISGLIVPRLIIQTFGSSTNGLVNSITQMLNYISLLEGGVSGVVMASYYKPLIEHDYKKISGIFKASNNFFTKIGIIYLGYLFIVAIVYPLSVKTSHSFIYVFSLTLILGIGLIIQYFLALSHKLLLDADQKVYITSLTQIVITIVNLIAVILLINSGCSIHIVKLGSGLITIIQSLVFISYTNKHYKLDKNVEPDTQALSQRWDGFGQNLAYFIHTNTDVLILTYFASLKDVSIYSVYFMVANALKNLTMAISRGFSPTLGNVLAKGNQKESNEVVDEYEFVINFVSIVLFTCGCSLIIPFVSVYVKGVNDANYIQPLFGIILLLAEEVYCLREPYVGTAYVCGKYKETAKYAYVEAGLNLVISLLLVKKYGLVGIAFGTLVSMVYRMISHVFYLKHNIIQRPVKKFLISLMKTIIITVLTYLIANSIYSVKAYSVLDFVIKVIPMASMVLIITCVFELIFNRRQMIRFLKVFKVRR